MPGLMNGVVALANMTMLLWRVEVVSAIFNREGHDDLTRRGYVVGHYAFAESKRPGD